MIPHNSYHLLYIQTLQHSEHKTKCCFSTYDMVLPFPINKLVPLYISDKVVLFPIKHQRAPLQTYINALTIIGLTSTTNGVIITFENNIQLRVDEPYSLIYKKWQESTLLHHLVQKTMQIY
ncbi:competence protein ComK [Staphylococcus haemolyticus]|uniref:competence protein ComK n=1 Tax=Staphylococcus haemolyticus TaxID=1283 RepID=UPI000D1DCB35|nr:competence protein ComK [Staphylococcus haemolyticus]MWF63483.1 competence protein ComK [Staphylococcus haemolyticus]PTK45470.1 competence protein ComK [Staphylococcus haemolyticus]PTK68702.1 competence protein ComK [Staphylococcus haemolyticus]PTK74335.1 competence protein ComK [Staphylococcus haemolyticus]